MKFFILITVLIVHCSFAVPEQEVRSLFKTYCYECHSNKKVKAKLNLETLSLDKDNPRWEDIWESVRHEEMPPEDEKPLPEHDRKNLLNYAEAILSQKAEVTPMRRLTRYEYDNSVRDIFELKTNIFIRNILEYIIGFIRQQFSFSLFVFDFQCNRIRFGEFWLSCLAFGTFFADGLLLY